MSDVSLSSLSLASGSVSKLRHMVDSGTATLLNAEGNYCATCLTVSVFKWSKEENVVMVPKFHSADRRPVITK